MELFLEVYLEMIGLKKNNKKIPWTSFEINFLGQLKFLYIEYQFIRCNFQASLRIHVSIPIFTGIVVEFFLVFTSDKSSTETIEVGIYTLL